MAIISGAGDAFASGFPIAQAEEIAAGYLEVNEQAEDFQEGPQAFVQKRKPEWKGR